MSETKMPWTPVDGKTKEYLDGIECRYWVENSNGEIVAYVFRAEHLHLIAAAPEMAELLELLVAYLFGPLEDCDCGDCMTVLYARDLLARIKGA